MPHEHGAHPACSTVPGSDPVAACHDGGVITDVQQLDHCGVAHSAEAAALSSLAVALRYASSASMPRAEGAHLRGLPVCDGTPKLTLQQQRAATVKLLGQVASASRPDSVLDTLRGDIVMDGMPRLKRPHAAPRNGCAASSAAAAFCARTMHTMSTASASVVDTMRKPKPPSSAGSDCCFATSALTRPAPGPSPTGSLNTCAAMRSTGHRGACSRQAVPMIPRT